MSLNTLPEFLRPYFQSLEPLRFTDAKLQAALNAKLAAIPPDHDRIQLRVDLDGAYAIGVKRIRVFGEDVSVRAIGGIDWEIRDPELALELVWSGR